MFKQAKIKATSIMANTSLSLRERGPTAEELQDLIDAEFSKPNATYWLLRDHVPHFQTIGRDLKESPWSSRLHVGTVQIDQPSEQL